MKKYSVTVNGQEYEVGVRELDGGAAPAPVARPVAVSAPAPAAPAAPKPAAPAPAGATSVSAPMPGKILSIAVSQGAAVKRGDVLLILEAMKMANEITAGADGTVAEIRVTAGQNVKTGDVLVVLS